MIPSPQHGADGNSGVAKARATRSRRGYREKIPLRVLVVEDSVDDARLVALELERGGYETRCERVETAEAMREVPPASISLPGTGRLRRRLRRSRPIDRVEADKSSTNAGNGAGRVDADVAILDTGIYEKHRDLNVSGGHNCVGSNTSAYSDGDGHGTHVAGSAAAEDNSTGVVGVAPGARLWAVKVLGNDGSGSFSSVICGIDRVTGKSGTIEVANLSLGATVTGTDDDSCGWTGNSAAAAMHRAICGSVDAGVFYAVAAGNDSKDFLNDVPAAFDQVLTVTAMADFDGEPGNNGISDCRPDQDDTFADFSNYTTTTTGSDDDHTIAAPGVCIGSTWPGNRRNKGGTYKMISGTSMASPHVAGTVALCIASNKCTGAPQDIMDRLRQDVAAQPTSYGFTGDPHTVPTGTYYGYLEYADGY